MRTISPSPRHRELASSTPPNVVPLTSKLTWNAPSSTCLMRSVFPPYERASTRLISPQQGDSKGPACPGPFALHTSLPGRARSRGATRRNASPRRSSLPATHPRTRCAGIECVASNLESPHGFARLRHEYGQASHGKPLNRVAPTLFLAFSWTWSLLKSTFMYGDLLFLGSSWT